MKTPYKNFAFCVLKKEETTITGTSVDEIAATEEESEPKTEQNSSNSMRMPKFDWTECQSNYHNQKSQYLEKKFDELILKRFNLLPGFDDLFIFTPTQQQQKNLAATNSINSDNFEGLQFELKRQMSRSNKINSSNVLHHRRPNSLDSSSQPIFGTGADVRDIISPNKSNSNLLTNIVHDNNNNNDESNFDYNFDETDDDEKFNGNASSFHEDQSENDNDDDEAEDEYYQDQNDRYII